MIFKIGIIEDETAEASAIMMSLTELSHLINEESFKLFGLKKNPGLRDELFQNIMQNIIDNKLQCMIVDYKLDTLKEVLSGTEIVEFLHENIPEFPVVILTNVPETGKENDKIDPDKVYEKKVFMDPEDERTRDMVHRIERNMERYTNKRSQLELEHQKLLEELQNGDEPEKDRIYGKLINIERELAKYVPAELSILDETIDLEDMNQALAALNEYKRLLE